MDGDNFHFRVPNPFTNVTMWLLVAFCMGFFAAWYWTALDRAMAQEATREARIAEREAKEAKAACGPREPAWQESRV